MTSAWPQGWSRSLPIPSSFGVYSQFVQVVPQQTATASQYTTGRSDQYLYASMSTSFGTGPVQFLNNADRIRYRKALLLGTRCN
jgi:hypothetical protein